MSKTMPYTYEEVYKHLKELQIIEGDLLAGMPMQMQMPPEGQAPEGESQSSPVEQQQSLPEQLPPRSPTAGI